MKNEIVFSSGGVCFPENRSIKDMVIRTGTWICCMMYDGEKTTFENHFVDYRDYDKYEDLPSVAKSEETYKEWCLCRRFMQI